MTRVLLKVNNKVMATDGKLLTSEKQEGSLLKPVLDISKSCEKMFYNYKGESLEGLISYNDTENVTNFSTMYKDCDNLIKAPSLNTSSATNISSMFNQCYKLQTIPPLDTSNVIYMNYTFINCYKLPKIDISYYNITSSSSTFASCCNLIALIIRSFGESYVLSTDSIKGCHHMLGTKNIYYNPEGLHDGYVYVPRDMITTLQSATNWSTLQFRALEDYTDDGTTTGKFLDEKAGI